MARAALNWSLQQLADASGVHRNTISNFETGKYAGEPEKLAAIRAALESAGVEFTNGGQPGVRMAKPTRAVEFQVIAGEENEPVLKGHDGDKPVIAFVSRACFEDFPLQADRLTWARRSRSALGEIANKKYLAGQFQVIERGGGTFRKIEIDMSDIVFSK
jgi:transcriptional regulator with XRE-family HTH domain